MPQTLNHRVEILEQQMEALSTLPDRVTSLESQIVQFRSEVRGEFAATRKELRDEMRSGDEAIRREMHALHAETLQRIHDGDDETRRHMRVLHEEVIARIALLDEHWNGAAKKSPAPKPSRRRPR